VTDGLRARFDFTVVSGAGTVVLGNLTLVPAAGPSVVAPTTVVPVAGAVLGAGLDELIVEQRYFEEGSLSGVTNGTTFASSRVSQRRDRGYELFLDLNLGRRFGQLQAAVGVSDDSSADFVVEYTITLDAQQPLTGTLGVGQLLPLDLPVTDGLRARFDFTVVSGAGTVVLGNLTLVPAG
jgi:hypothetical protein